jgi:hypothetical protein
MQEIAVVLNGDPISVALEYCLLLLQFFSGSFLLSHFNLKSYNLTEVCCGRRLSCF